MLEVPSSLVLNIKTVLCFPGIYSDQGVSRAQSFTQNEKNTITDFYFLLKPLGEPALFPLSASSQGLYHFKWLDLLVEDNISTSPAFQESIIQEKEEESIKYILLIFTVLLFIYYYSTILSYKKSRCYCTTVCDTKSMGRGKTCLAQGEEISPK